MIISEMLEKETAKDKVTASQASFMPSIESKADQEKTLPVSLYGAIYKAIVENKSVR